MSMDFNLARHLMVEQQVRPAEVLDPRVLAAMAQLPREDFVPPLHRKLAFTDTLLPIGHGEMMLSPVLEGRLLQALDVADTDEVLVIGTGSGHLTALLATLTRAVHSIDIHADFLTATAQRLQQRGLANVRLEEADALAWQAPHGFDAIVVTGAVAQLPAAFSEWLNPGGRLVAVVGQSPAQEAVCVRRDSGALVTESLFETDIPYLRGAAPVARFQL